MSLSLPKRAVKSSVPSLGPSSICHGVRRGRSKALIRQLTIDNRTRELALELAERTADDLEPDEYDTATSDLHWQMGLADTKGMTWRGMLRQMTCRELAMERAKALVDEAQAKIQAAQLRRR